MEANTSKGFANFDNDEAEKQEQEQLKKQQEQVEQSIGKSTNNFLNDLSVEEYEISPSFDKQTINYTINETVKANTIKINAVASDDKAKIEGAGKVKLNNDKNEIHIDVKAESGTVRTYIISLTAEVTASQEDSESEAVVSEEQEITENTVQEIDNTVVETSHFPIYLGIVGIVLIIAIVCGVIYYKRRVKKC